MIEKSEFLKGRVVSSLEIRDRDDIQDLKLRKEYCAYEIVINIEGGPPYVLKGCHDCPPDLE